MEYKVQMQNLEKDWISVSDIERYPAEPVASVTPIQRNGVVVGTIEMSESTITPKFSEACMDKTSADALYERLIKEFPRSKFRVIEV